MAKSMTRSPSDAKAGAPRKLVSEQREGAYYKAKQRGFAPGYELKDWIEAEAEIMTRLGMQP
jgi:hypothetical protein